jgi:hypothetical protein
MNRRMSAVALHGRIGDRFDAVTTGVTHKGVLFVCEIPRRKAFCFEGIRRGCR